MMTRSSWTLLCTLLLACSGRDEKQANVRASHPDSVSERAPDSTDAARSTQQVDSGSYAWWVTARFTPTGDTVGSIPIRMIDTSWAKASVLTRDMLPPKAAAPGQWTDTTYGFVREGDFDHDGRQDRAMVGVYQAKSGEVGRFLLVVTQRQAGKWQKAFLATTPGEAGFSVLFPAGDGIGVSSCMECDSWAKLTSTPRGYELQGHS
jgi:hypothetical protein